MEILWPVVPGLPVTVRVCPVTVGKLEYIAFNAAADRLLLANENETRTPRLVICLSLGVVNIVVTKAVLVKEGVASVMVSRPKQPSNALRASVTADSG